MCMYVYMLQIGYDILFLLSFAVFKFHHTRKTDFLVLLLNVPSEFHLQIKLCYYYVIITLLTLIIIMVVTIIIKVISVVCSFFV